MTGPVSSYAAPNSGPVQSTPHIASSQPTRAKATTTRSFRPPAIKPLLLVSSRSRVRRNRPNRNRNRKWSRAQRDREAYAYEQQVIELTVSGNPGRQFTPPTNPQSNPQARFTPGGPLISHPVNMIPGQPPQSGGPIINNPVQTTQGGTIGHEVTDHSHTSWPSAYGDGPKA